MAHVWQDRALAQGAATGGTVTTSATAAAPKARIDVLEGLRFVAALGIVWFHMAAPGALIAGGALALFLALSAFFSVPSLLKSGPEIFWRTRVQRIMIPWIFWCAFYLVVNAERMGGLAPALRLENPWALLIGPSIHLWFLPFIFLTGLPICLLAPRIRSRAALLVLAAAALPLSVGMLWIAEGTTLPPFEQWTVAFTPTAYGLVAFLALRLGLPLVAPILIVLTCAGALAAGATESLIPLMVGVCAFEIGRRVTWRAPILREFGRIAFPIYLVHPFFMFAFFKFGGESGTVLSALTVFGLSALASAVMVRVPGLRALV